MGRLRQIGALGLVLGLAAMQPGFAQTNTAPPKTQPPAAQAPAPGGAATLDPYKLNILIRSSIIALNQATQTGNYTVLLDLAAPAFRASNSSARLMQIFANLRQRGLDLSPILFFTPKLVQQPMVNPNGILRLVGYFPTSPERVNFDLYFQSIEGEWRIFGIGVVMSPAEVTSAIEQQPQPQPQGGPIPQARQEPAPPNAHAATAPPPTRKQSPAKQSNAGGAASSVQERTTNNATQINLSPPKTDAANFVTSADPAGNEQAPDAEAQSGGDFWSKLNPFTE
jgi:hypothetical protein